MQLAYSLFNNSIFIFCFGGNDGNRTRVQNKKFLLSSTSLVYLTL